MLDSGKAKTNWKVRATSGLLILNAILLASCAGGGGGTSVNTGGNGGPPAAPAITSLSPLSTNAGGPAFSLTVNGTNFVSSSVVNWNGSARDTIN
jgi:hypothetical protein